MGFLTEVTINLPQRIFGLGSDALSKMTMILDS